MTSKILITDIPDDILFFISDMVRNVNSLSRVNKKFNFITQKRKNKYLKEYKEFISRVINSEKKFCGYINGFYKVRSIQDCIFLKNGYVKIYGEKNFINRLKITLKYHQDGENKDFLLAWKDYERLCE